VIARNDLITLSIFLRFFKNVEEGTSNPPSRKI